MGWYESRRGYSTVADVCTMYGVTEKTVVRWIERGYLAAEIFEHEKPKYWILDTSLQQFDTLTSDVFKTLPNDLSKKSRSIKLAHKLEKIFGNDDKEDKFMEEKHENEIENDNKEDEYMAEKHENEIENDNKEDEYMAEKHENEIKIEDVKAVSTEPKGYISVEELNRRLLKIKKLQDAKDEFIERGLRLSRQLLTAVYCCEEDDIPKDKFDELWSLVYNSPEVRRMDNDIDNELDSVENWMKELGVSDLLLGLVVE